MTCGFGSAVFWSSAMFRCWYLIGWENVCDVWHVWNDSGSASFFLLEDCSPQEGVFCSLMHDPLRVHNTPEPIPACWPCLSFRLICCTATHVETNAYPAPGKPQDVSGRSTIRRLLHLPLELSHLTLGLGEALTVVLTCFPNVLSPRHPRVVRY